MSHNGMAPSPCITEDGKGNTVAVTTALLVTTAFKLLKQKV
jgi:hypothetical protein